MVGVNKNHKSLPPGITPGFLPRLGAFNQRADDTGISGILPCSANKSTAKGRRGVARAKYTAKLRPAVLVSVLSPGLLPHLLTQQ